LTDEARTRRDGARPRRKLQRDASSASVAPSPELSRHADECAWIDQVDGTNVDAKGAHLRREPADEFLRSERRAFAKPTDNVDRCGEAVRLEGHLRELHSHIP
jgi:hypothetical protein